MSFIYRASIMPMYISYTTLFFPSMKNREISERNYRTEARQDDIADENRESPVQIKEVGKYAPVVKLLH